jgi:hypothetical protein
MSFILLICMIPRSLIVLIAEEGLTRPVHPSVERNQEELDRKKPYSKRPSRYPGSDYQDKINEGREIFLGLLGARPEDLYKKG